MDVLIYGRPSSTALGRMCLRGLESLGHDVEYFERDGISLPVIGEINTGSIVSKFVRSVTTRDPDLVLVIKGYDIHREAVETMSDDDTVVVNWNPDNPYQVRSTRKRAETYLDAVDAYDHMFTWGDFLGPKLRDAGASRVSSLPFGYDPKIHRPEEPDERYECPVAFFGHYSKKRERFLSPLTDHGLQIWGNGWRRNCFDRSLRATHRGAALDPPDYSRGMAAADIVVNVVADHNLPAHNMRTFEIPATGSLMLTTHSTGQAEYFPDDRGCVMYETPDELSTLVAEYLDNPSERRRIGSQARELVEGHAYEDRMARLVEVVSDAHPTIRA